MKGANEHSEQVAVIEWAIWNWVKYPELELLRVVPNVEPRNMEAGVCDLFLPVARWVDPMSDWIDAGEPMYKPFHGLYIGMKSAADKVSQEQQDFIDKVQKQGYMAVVCCSAKEAIGQIEKYLKGKKWTRTCDK